jgi:pantoate--beta-alanine ligase
MPSLTTQNDEMIIVKKASALWEIVDYHRRRGEVVGFVPTMGALHAGHLELITQSAARSAVTIISIFVNPTQFNDAADYRKYPRHPEADIQLLAASPATILFFPEAGEVYNKGTEELEHYDIGYLETILEGSYRPGHFQGVSQVMSRLLKMVSPDLLFMGRKDYQQCMVVERVIGLLGLPVRLIACPTVREADGLAKSSRNLRLNAEQRAKAPLIFQTLQKIKAGMHTYSSAELEQNAIGFLNTNGFKVDYVKIARASDLLDPSDKNAGVPLVALVAAFLGDVRLIDNLTLS